MSDPVNDLLHIKASRNDALLLFVMIAKYQHGLQQYEFQLALPRLKTEFERFEQWLRGIHGVDLE